MRCCWARRRCAGSDQSDELHSRRAGRLMAKVNNEHTFSRGSRAHSFVRGAAVLLGPWRRRELHLYISTLACWSWGEGGCRARPIRRQLGSSTSTDPHSWPGKASAELASVHVDARSQHPQSVCVLLSSQAWPRKLVFSAIMRNPIQIIEKGHKPSHHSITVCTHPSRARTSTSTHYIAIETPSRLHSLRLPFPAHPRRCGRLRARRQHSHERLDA